MVQKQTYGQSLVLTLDEGVELLEKTCLRGLLVRAIMQKNRLSHISIEQSEHTAGSYECFPLPVLFGVRGKKPDRGAQAFPGPLRVLF